MSTLPKLALAIRQPWAWAVIHARKDIENRDWRRPNPCLDFRGRVAIHASSGLTRGEYEQAQQYMAKIGVTCPAAIDLRRGGIIGTVEVVDIVRQWQSPWFMGPLGLLLRDPLPCEFVPVSGALGFFDWKGRTGAPVPEPAKWMLPELVHASSDQGTLL